MKKLSSTLPHMILSLGLITIIAGAILAEVYNVTKEPISQVERQKKIDAIAEVAPPFDNDPMTDTVNIDGSTVHIAKMGDEIVGAAVESSSPNGFSGTISLIYGFSSDGTITGYAVISHAETPGLGAKMGEWFCDSIGRRSVIGRNPADGPLTVSNDGGDVDAITAATITSRAFLDALNRAYTAFNATKENVK